MTGSFEHLFSSGMSTGGSGICYWQIPSYGAVGSFEFSEGSSHPSIDSNRQTSTQGLNFSQETRPKTKFFSLLIYAGYPMQ